MPSQHQVVVLVEELHAGVAAAQGLHDAWAALGLEVELVSLVCSDRDVGYALDR